MEWWHAVILGLVEGITEYLPVSSTGHLIIVSSLLGLDDPGRPDHKAALDAFNIVVQGGAILAVLGLYWPRVVQMLRGLLGRDPAGLRLAINLVVAFIPAAISGKLLHDWIEAKLFHPGPVTAALIIGGVYMMAIEQWRLGRFGHVSRGGPAGEGLSVDDITIPKALFIGMMQCVALIPGTSRSMMTITGGVMARLRPAAAAEFSFLLGLPTLGAATLYSLYKNLTAGGAGSHAGGAGGASHGGSPANLFEVLGVGPVVIGLIVATISAAIAVKWLVAFLNRRGLTPFGWYRIVLGVCLIGLMLGEVVRR
ncbi:MAG: undecaprenyl-diphosphate phosphatase [Phycisphaerales bacterium]